MFGIGMPEMLLILAIALIVIGPKKLPDLAKSLGRAMREFKKATSELKTTLEIDQDLSEVKHAFDDLKKDASDIVTPASGDKGPTAAKDEAGLSALEPGDSSAPAEAADDTRQRDEKQATESRSEAGTTAEGSKLEDLKKAFDNWNAADDPGTGPESTTAETKPKGPAEDAQ